MYESPIKIIAGKIQTQIDDEIYRAVQNVGINVDREELLKALEYDRGQYEEGFREGEKHDHSISGRGGFVRMGRSASDSHYGNRTAAYHKT